jgi:hypothetical protein
MSNFHAWRDNLPPGCSDRDIDERFGGDDIVDDEDQATETNNQNAHDHPRQNRNANN